MFHTPRILTTLFLAASLAAAACSPKQPVAPGTLTTIEGLLDALRGQQITVRAVEQLPRDSHPYFSVPATVVEMNGETVSVFRYARTSDADREAATIAPNGGSIGTSMLSWMGPPHFYKKDALIVLYVGTSPTVTAALTAALGPQIAGR